MPINEKQLEYVETDAEVRYAETDQMGVAYYGNYLTWFEVGRVNWFRAKGFSYRDMEADDACFLMVAEAKCRYKSPARFEDKIVIRTGLQSASERIIRFRYEIRDRQSSRMIATGETAHVITDPEYRPIRLPNRYRACFSLPPRD